MESPDQYRPRRSRRSRSSLILPISILCLALAILAGAVLIYLKSDIPADPADQNTSPLVATPGQGNKTQQQGKLPAVTADSGTLDRETGLTENSQSGGAEQESSLEQPLPPFSKEQEKSRHCMLMAEQLHAFFTQLDQEEYIMAFSLSQPTQEHFTDLAAKLLANPPVVTRESDELYTILKNMAHFFRIIGKQNILLIKGILDREREQVEDIAAIAYQWIDSGDCTSDLFQLEAPLKQIYEYAGFFLNTMGGRSYLFRRDSRSRLLVNYYSVLIIDHANREGLNYHGIDVEEIIPQLIGEIEATNQLIYKEAYLDHLYDLQENNL